MTAKRGPRPGPRPAVLAWIGAMAAAIAGAGIAIAALGAAERRRVDAAVRQAAEGAARRLAEAISSELQALELLAQGAGAHPRLVAALSAEVSVETLRDLVRTEPWWQPYREGFRGAYLVAGPAGPVRLDAPEPAARAPQGIEAVAHRARASRRVAAAWMPAASGAHAVIAVPVALPTTSAVPVLVLVRPFDADTLGRAAEQAGGAAVLTNGRQAQIGAGAAAELALVRRAAGHEARGSFAPEPHRWAATAVPVAAGVWAIVHVSTRGPASQIAATFAALKIAAGTACLALLGVAGLALRRLGHGGAAAGRAAQAQAQAATPVAPAEAGAPAHVGRYLLVGKLGGGGMSEIHLAVSLGESGFRRPCVLKRLRPELSDNPLAVAQFTDEATVASTLVHSNIVPIFDFGRAGSQYYLVEEYVPGRDLGRLVRALAERGARLPPALVASVAVQTLLALDYAHHRCGHDGLPLGIVHRDVSPENIMVSLRGEVKLLDFGVLKARGARAGKTEVGALKGNIAFVAPEQARAEEVDARADVFAAGMVAYFALTGEPLYGPPAGYDVLVKAAAGPGLGERAKIARLPAPFAGALARALDPDPARRFPSAAAFADDLAAAAEPSPAALAALVSELFATEIAREQQGLATPSASIRPFAPLVVHG